MDGARPPGGHVPVRRCVGCGARAPRASLLRFATVDGVLAPDPGAHMPGRGAWLHPALECWERALSRRAFHRALRRSVIVPADTVDLVTEWQRSASTS